MAARLHVVEGTAQGRSFWIEREVSRVGSSMPCELQIEGLPEHALTLQYRGGAYFVFNRGHDSLYLNDVEILPSQATRWPGGSRLQVGRWAILRLDATGKDAPEPAPSAALDDEPRGPVAPAPAAQPRDKSQQERMQITVICLALFATTVFLFSGMTSRPAVTLSDRFESLNNHLQFNVPAADLQLVSMHAVLRRAFRNEMQDRTRQALNEYLFIRDRIIRRQNEDFSWRTECDARMLEFVQERIAALAR